MFFNSYYKVFLFNCASTLKENTLLIVSLFYLFAGLIGLLFYIFTNNFLK